MTTFTVSDSWADYGTVSGTATFTPFPARTGSPVVAQISNSVLSVALPVGSVTGIQQYVASFSNVTLGGFDATINTYGFVPLTSNATFSMRHQGAHLAPTITAGATFKADQQTIGSNYRPLKGVTAAITPTLASGADSSGVGSTIWWDPSLNSGPNLSWRYAGCVPVALQGADPNPFVGLNNNNGFAQDNWYQPITLEFWSNATKIDIYAYAFGKPDYWVLVDDERIVDGTYLHYTGSDGEVTLELTQESAVWRKWRVSMMNSIIGVGYNVDGVMVPTTPGYQMAVLGDSYVQGALSISNAVSDGVAGLISSGAIWGEYEQFTGIDIWRAGLQGTGYVEPGSLGSSGPFGSPLRIAALAAMPPMDAVVIFGSVNDSSHPAASVAVAATACWDAVAAAQPTAKIIVVGPECLNVTPSTGTTANNNALKAAAENSANVTAYIDLLAEPFITGTGFDGSPEGDGNADAFISADDLHPTHIGCRYWAERLAAILSPVAFQA